MVNIDFLTLKAFLLENIDFIKGSRVQKIQQPTRRDFIFLLRNNGHSEKFYVNIYPQIYHIALMSKENEAKRNIVIPKNPPMFCMLLRKYLEGAKISDVIAVQNERILELIFDTYDELSQKRQLCLAIELMGKYSNLIFYDKNTSVIIGCAHNVGSEKSRYRELQGGLKYIYPNRTDSLSNELKQQFNKLSQNEIDKYLIATEFTPAIKDNRYTLFSELIEGSIRENSVNSMLDNYYARIQEEFLMQTERTKLLEIVNKKMKKTESAISKISNLLNQRSNQDQYTENY